MAIRKLKPIEERDPYASAVLDAYDKLEPVKNKTWITDTLPDSDMTVLVRRQDEEFPVWPGYHDGEVWVDSDGFAITVPVLGWLHLEDAAALLDPRPPAEPKPCCKDLGQTTAAEFRYLWYRGTEEGKKAYLDMVRR